jgi:hypothetical protein
MCTANGASMRRLIEYAYEINGSTLIISPKLVLSWRRYLIVFGRRERRVLRRKAIPNY